MSPKEKVPFYVSETNGKEIEKGREFALPNYPYVGKCEGDGGSEVGNCVSSFDGGVEGARDGDLGDFNDFEAVGGYEGLIIMLVYVRDEVNTGIRTSRALRRAVVELLDLAVPRT